MMTLSPRPKRRRISRSHGRRRQIHELPTELNISPSRQVLTTACNGGK